MERLTRAEREISLQFEQNIMKLETKYKILINNLIDEKILIQQKLRQSYSQQVHHLFKLKLSLIQDETQQPMFVKKSMSNNNGNNNKNNNNHENGVQNVNALSDGVDLGLPVKKEHPISSGVNSNVNINSHNINPPPHELSTQSEVKFDINKTEEAMKKKIKKHITKLGKKKSGKKYSCNICRKTFVNLASVQQHVGSQHLDINEKPFKCNQCDKRFALWRLLNHHQIIHSSKYQCKFCGKKCHHSQSLKIHESRHSNSGERPFECNVCHKKFAKKRTSKYQCKICAKNTQSQSHLKIHMRKHSKTNI